MSLAPLTELPADEIERLWGLALPARYRVGPELFLKKSVRHPLFLSDGSAFAQGPGSRVSGFIALKREPGPPGCDFGNPKNVHITALAAETAEAADVLLAHAEKSAKEAGFGKLIFGADLGHIFPGLPVECGDLLAWLTSRGFETGEGLSHDVQRDLGDYQAPEWSVAPLARPDISVRPLKNDQIDDVEAWLQREFPGRWRLDVMEKCRTLGEPGDVLALWVADKIEGFAYTQTDSTKLPSAGAVWELDLGPNWGALGPIGVSKGVRGQGLGHALLAAGLLSLQQRGARQTIIDWTTLLDFYGAHGFADARQYRSLWLSLA